MTLMEKLLVPAAMRRVVEDGQDTVAGPVVRAADLTGSVAAERVAAYGLESELFPFGSDPDHVDVIRFETNPLMLLTTPTPDGSSTQRERPWPTYPFGFLFNAAPVWQLQLTRVPMGARFVRIARDGTERELSTYGGAAWGWQRARGYRPPLEIIGPRATWQGHDLPGSYTEDQESIELVWVGEAGAPEGFTPSRPRVLSRVVPLSACDSVFEVTITGRWRDAPVRILQQAGGSSRLLLLDPDLDTVNRLGATAEEPDQFYTSAPTDEVVERQGVVLEPGSPARLPDT